VEPFPAPQVLEQADWQRREGAHRARVGTLLAGHLERAGRGEAHPVEDFLFSYYSLRPGQLRRWHPGAGVALAGPAAERLGWRHYQLLDGGIGVDPAAFAARRGPAIRYVRAVLEATLARTPQLGCFGLHEWAMVYRQDVEQRRHARWPLRLGPAGTDAVVEGQRIRCTHHDAFRFFTPAAMPRNALQPARTDQVALEQPGCLHATMDLYKWCYKLSPAVGSDLTLDCLELARDARELDMRASPYDLQALGYQPVAIETPEGRAGYVAQQRAIAGRGQELRARLIAACAVLPAADPSDLLEPIDPEGGPDAVPGTAPAQRRGTSAASNP
jgi:hypothetical protein